MTTYSYTLVLNDSEMITLNAALGLMAEHCDRELKNGAQSPFFVWRRNAEQIQARLCANRLRTSGGGIDEETGEYSIWVDLQGRPPKDSKT